MANREIFGPEERVSDTGRELEKAYQTEILLSHLQPGQLLDQEDLLVVAPTGSPRVEAGKALSKNKTVLMAEVVAGETKRRISLASGEIVVITVDPGVEIKLKISCHEGWRLEGKDRAEWTGKDKEKLVFKA